MRPSSVAKLLKKHRLRRLRADSVLATLRADPVTVAPGVVSAATAHVRLLAPAAGPAQPPAARHGPLSGGPGRQPHRRRRARPRGSRVSSATGRSSRLCRASGRTVLATLLAEASGPLHSRDCQALRCLCGVAPVTRRSGKARRVIRRWASQPRLVNAAYHWSPGRGSQHDPLSRAKYQALRARGHTHGRALRSVADRLLAVACAMLRAGTLFDPGHAAVAR